jgi:uncharacterized lipoprotein YddW (UPF0748 family)
MKDRLGRPLFRSRTPRTGFHFRAFLPVLFLTVFLCACLSGASLPLPHPIPPPAEDPPPATQTSTPTTKPATQTSKTATGQSTPTTTNTATKPAATTTKPASTTTSVSPVQQATLTTAASSSAPVRVNSKPLRDISGNVVTTNGNYGGSPVLLPVEYTAKPNEFRGIWVATAFNLDFAKHSTVAEFQASFRSLAARIAAMGFNTIMFQVRPSCDAFYPSSINPWSRWLTGEEGKPLAGGFDPVAFMIAESHRRGLKFYAWMNPYRVGQVDTSAASTYLRTLSSGNFARKNPGLVVRWDNKKTNLSFFFLDPGRAEVVAHVVNSVREVLERYKPDGVVFDDYFYPIGVDDTCDAATFRKFGRKGQTLADWRRANTELLVRSVAGTVRAFNRLNGTSIPFGISPVGIWANRSEALPDGSPSKGVEAYSQSFADVRKWVKNSWIDFVIPQINWGFANKIAPFAGIVNWWADLVRGTNVKLYAGIGVYNAGVTAGMESPSEISNQVLYLMLRKEVSGVVFFAARHCLNPQNNAQRTSLRTVFNSYWRPAQPSK